MQISFDEALVVAQTLLNSNTFTTKQTLKILATSADELEFPFPYENIIMGPTTYRTEFLLYFKDDPSKRGEKEMDKLVKRLIEESELHPCIVKL